MNPDSISIKRKYWLIYYLFGLTALIFLQSCVSSRALKSTTAITAVSILQNKIDVILQDSILTQTRTGIKIVSLDNGEILYSRDSQLLFHPASNMKLLTTATALKNLGVDFRFKTELLTDSSSNSLGERVGNLYLKGYGNPDLSTADLREIVQSLKEQGLNCISGDLLCDDSYFDELFLGSGWMWDDVNCWSCASISPLSVNDNCVEVKIKPAASIGEKPIVSLNPPTGYVQLENQAITVDSLDTLELDRFKVEREWIHPANIIRVQGGVSILDSLNIFTIDIVDPTLYTGTLFSELLAEASIEFSGSVKHGTAPGSAVVLTTHWSESLPIVAYNTNKVSDNLSAELLLKTLGAEKIDPPGTAKKGIAMINQYLNEIGLDTSNYQLADGSGVSRYNLITPDLLIELLKDMHQDFKIQVEFKSSLPIAAVDGTLKERMENSGAAEKLRAKTGTLSGVSSLSGYTTSVDGENIAFSMIMEHFIVPASKIRRIQDQIGEVISNFSRKSVK
jgi:D-alanyl-D-alanine carboxypeptidase/D-alanyl-D-alanine-endopeptidase (penicillin-binding protein 4)